jgi:nitrilase
MGTAAADSKKKLIKIAAVQAASVFLDKKESTEKVCQLILEAGRNSADVIGFPETFIPGYPGWVEVLPLSTEPATSLFCKLFNQSVEVPGPETEAISAACKEADLYAVVGINERRPNTTGTLWNTQLFFGRDGTLLHRHQKYVPTKGERLVHALGDTGSNSSVKTDFGCLSGLICGENGNPLAQYSLSLDYPVVHVASWPPHFCPGADVQDAAQLYTCGLASSLGCYVVNAVAAVDDIAIQAYSTNDSIREFLRTEKMKRRATIVAPGGAVLAGSPPNMVDELVYADVDVDNLVKFKYVLVSWLSFVLAS